MNWRSSPCLKTILAGKKKKAITVSYSLFLFHTKRSFVLPFVHGAPLVLCELCITTDILEKFFVALSCLFPLGFFCRYVDIGNYQERNREQNRNNNSFSAEILNLPWIQLAILFPHLKKDRLEKEESQGKNNNCSKL